MPLNRITGNAFSGSPLRRGYTPPQQAFERIQGISRRLQEVLANPGTNRPQLGLSPVGNGELFDQSKTTAEWREGMAVPQRVPMSQQSQPYQTPFNPLGITPQIVPEQYTPNMAGPYPAGSMEDSILQTQMIGQRGRQSVIDQGQRRADQQRVLDQDTRREFSPSNVWEMNSRNPPLQPAPPEIDLSPAARNQRTSLNRGRMMPGGEQMQDRFMGGPLAAQADYLGQGQAMAAAGLGTMIPGPYGQIGQFIPKRQGVMEEAEAAMPGRLASGEPGQGFTRRNEGGLAYTSRAQAFRDAGNPEVAQRLDDALAARVAKVQEGRRAMGLPVGPAARRAERDQKKMDRMLKVQGRQLQRMGISPLSPQAALLAPEAFNRAKEAMQGGAGGGASALKAADGTPVPLVAQGAAKTPTSLGNAQTAYRALLEQTPLFKAAGVELGQEGGSPPALNQVVPKVNSWLKESKGAMSERDLEGLHQLAIQAAHNATKSSDPFKGGWSPMFASGSEETRLALEKMKELSEIPLKDKQKRQVWWNSYSQNILGLNQKPAGPLQGIFNDNGRPPVGDTDWGQEPPGVFGRFMGMF